MQLKGAQKGIRHAHATSFLAAQVKEQQSRSKHAWKLQNEGEN